MSWPSANSMSAKRFWTVYDITSFPMYLIQLDGFFRYEAIRITITHRCVPCIPREERPSGQHRIDIDLTFSRRIFLYLIGVDTRICYLRSFVIFANILQVSLSWWRHQMEAFSASLALYAGNSPVSVEFRSQRLVTRSFDVLFDPRFNKRLSNQ